MRSGPGEARTILLLHIISVRPSKQPLMVRTFLKVYHLVELGSYFLFLHEQKKNISDLYLHEFGLNLVSCVSQFSLATLASCATTMTMASRGMVSSGNSVRWISSPSSSRFTAGLSAKPPRSNPGSMPWRECGRVFITSRRVSA